MNNFCGKLDIFNIEYIYDNKGQIISNEWIISASIFEPIGTFGIDSLNIGDTIFIDTMLFYNKMSKYIVTEIVECNDFSSYIAKIKWGYEEDCMDPLIGVDSVICSTTELGLHNVPDPNMIILPNYFVNQIQNEHNIILNNLILKTQNDIKNGFDGDYNKLTNKPNFVNDVSLTGSNVNFYFENGNKKSFFIQNNSSGGNGLNKYDIIFNQEASEAGEYKLNNELDKYDFLWVKTSCVINGITNVFSNPIFLNVKSIKYVNWDQFKFRADLGAHMTFTFLDNKTLKIIKHSPMKFDKLVIDEILGISMLDKDLENELLKKFEIHMDEYKENDEEKNVVLNIPSTHCFDFSELSVMKLVHNNYAKLDIDFYVKNYLFDFSNKNFYFENKITNKFDSVNEDQIILQMDDYNLIYSTIQNVKINSNKRFKVVFTDNGDAGWITYDFEHNYWHTIVPTKENIKRYGIWNHDLSTISREKWLELRLKSISFKYVIEKENYAGIEISEPVIDVIFEGSLRPAIHGVDFYSEYIGNTQLMIHLLNDGLYKIHYES